MVMWAAEHACTREGVRLCSRFTREAKVLKSNQYVSYYSLLSFLSFRSLTVQQGFACKFIKTSLDTHRERTSLHPPSRRSPYFEISEPLYPIYPRSKPLWRLGLCLLIRCSVLGGSTSQICCRRHRIRHRIEPSDHPIPYGLNPEILVSCLPYKSVSFWHSGTLKLTCISYWSLNQG